MSAIRTKLLPATLHRPMRVKAWLCWNPKVSVTLSEDPESYNQKFGLHTQAVLALLAKERRRLHKEYCVESSWLDGVFWTGHALNRTDMVFTSLAVGHTVQEGGLVL